MATERSLILCKPDCIQKRNCGEVIKRFEQAGFSICGAKMMRLSSDLLKEHYAHVADRPFFPEIEAFMQSSPVLALVLEGEQVIGRVRDMLGPTNSREAAPGTIRGDHGTNMMVNVCHASDSPETAEVEVKRFFRDEEIFSY